MSYIECIYHPEGASVLCGLLATWCHFFAKCALGPGALANQLNLVSILVQFRNMGQYLWLHMYWGLPVWSFHSVIHRYMYNPVVQSNCIHLYYVSPFGPCHSVLPQNDNFIVLFVLYNHF